MEMMMTCTTYICIHEREVQIWNSILKRQTFDKLLRATNLFGVTCESALVSCYFLIK